MDILTSFLISILQYTAEKYIDKKRERDDYEKLLIELARTFENWIDRLPESAFVAKEAFLPIKDTESEFKFDEFQKIQTALENNENPDPQLWKNGLFKYWKKKSEILGEEGTNFFQLDDDTVIKYIAKLSVKLTDTCQYHDTIFKATLLHRTKPNIDETTRVLKIQFRELIHKGELERVNSYIEVIRRNDDLMYHHSIKTMLIIFETEICILKHDRSKYKDLIRSIELLEPSFEKYFYLFTLKNHFDSGYSIQQLIADNDIQISIDELSYIYDLKWNNKNTFVDRKLEDFIDESRYIIAEYHLELLVNKLNPVDTFQYIKDNSEYLTSIHSQLLCQANRIQNVEINEFKGELTVDGKKELSIIYQSIRNIESITNHFNDDFKSTLYRLKAICLYWLNNEDWKNEQFLIKNTINIEIFLQFLFNNRDIEGSIYLLDKNKSLYEKPELTSIIIKILLLNGSYDKIITYSTFDNLSEEDQTFINISKKLMISKDKKEKLLESDIILDTDNLEDPSLLLTIIKIFIAYKKIELANKYFKVLLGMKKTLDEPIIIEMGIIADRLNHKKESIEILKPLASNENVLNILTSLLMDSREQIFQNNKLLSELFRDVDIQTSSSFNLRQKVQYLNIIGDPEQGLDLLKKIAIKFDIDLDWTNLSMFLAESRLIDEIEEVFALLSKKEETFNILLGKIFLLLFIGNNKETRLENFGKAFFDLHIKFASNIDLPPYIYSKIYIIIVMEQLRISGENKYFSKDTIIEAVNNKTQENINICVHDSKIENSQEIFALEALHFSFDDTRIADNLYKKVGEEIVLNDKQYTIRRIDSIWHYPALFINTIIMIPENASETGFRAIEIKKDNPLESLMGELAESKEHTDEQINSYLFNQIYPLYTLANRDYKKIIGAIATLLETDKYFYRAGIGIHYSSLEKSIISYSSIIILHLFGKLQSIDPKMITTTSTIISTLEKFTSEMEINPTETKLSISLDSNHIPIKYVSIEEDNISQIISWKNSINFLKKTNIVNTKNIALDLLAYIPFIGKSDAACVQMAKNNNMFLITDDNSIHLICQASKHDKVSNVIPFYWKYSNEPFKSKIEFLNKLSNLSYQFIIFPEFIRITIEYMINNHKLIVGTNTEIGLFISLINKEVKNNINIVFLIREIIKGLTVVVQNFIKSNSELVYLELISVLNKKQIKIVYDSLIKTFPVGPYLKFIISCHSKIK